MEKKIRLALEKYVNAMNDLDEEELNQEKFSTTRSIRKQMRGVWRNLTRAMEESLPEETLDQKFQLETKTLSINDILFMADKIYDDPSFYLKKRRESHLRRLLQLLPKVDIDTTGLALKPSLKRKRSDSESSSSSESSSKESSDEEDWSDDEFTGHCMRCGTELSR